MRTLKTHQVRFAFFQDETDKAVFYEVGIRAETDEGWSDEIVPLWLPKSQCQIFKGEGKLYITPWIAEKKEEEIAHEYGYRCCEILLEEEAA